MKPKGRLYFIFVFLLLIVLSGFYQQELKHVKEEPPYEFVNDIDQHYSYLVAGVIHGDLGFNFGNNYWLVNSPKGGRIQRVTMGMAYLYSPFFLVGHAIALGNSNYEANGYSYPYSVAMHCGSVFYVLLGIYFLMLCLNRYFNTAWSIAIALIVLFGTNLFYYTYGVSQLSHSYLFTLNVLFVYLTMKWHDKPSRKTLFLLAFLFGLMVLIRPTEILLVFFPLFYKVYDFSSLKKKVQFLGKQIVPILLSLFFFILPILPQMIYWKLYGGDWVIYSYGEEGFFFDKPHLIDYLFSYRKGWLLYTPIMALALIGLAYSFKRNKDMAWGIVLFLVPSIYVFASWWCWWYGGSFGMRTMVEYYGFLAFPLGALLVYTKKWAKGVVLLLCFAFVALNLFQTHQFYRFLIHYDANSKATYWQNFLKYRYKDQADIDLYHENLFNPDYENALKGKPERAEDERE